MNDTQQVKSSSAADVAPIPLTTLDWLATPAYVPVPDLDRRLRVIMRCGIEFFDRRPPAQVRDNPESAKRHKEILEMKKSRMTADGEPISNASKLLKEVVDTYPKAFSSHDFKHIGISRKQASEILSRMSANKLIYMDHKKLLSSAGRETVYYRYLGEVPAKKEPATAAATAPQND